MNLSIFVPQLLYSTCNYTNFITRFLASFTGRLSDSFTIITSRVFVPRTKSDDFSVIDRQRFAREKPLTIQLPIPPIETDNGILLHIMAWSPCVVDHHASD